MVSNVKFSMLMVSLFLVAQGCTTDPVSPTSQNAVASGDAVWRVTWYWDKDKDETSDFAQYIFYFRSNGSFDAVRNGATTQGSWRTTTDDGTQRLVLASSTAKPLSNLNDNWVILESGDQIIRLKDDNISQLEELTFERIQ